MAVATADWNSAMNGTGVCGAKGCEARGGPRRQKPERENDVRYCLERGPRVTLSAACVRSPVQPRETLTPERTVLPDAEAAARILLAFYRFVLSTLESR